jgi:hypothetical protein
MLISEIAEYLQFKNIGIFDEVGTSGNIFIMTMPASPDNSISLYNRGGSPGDGKLGYDPISIELIIRGTRAIETQQRGQNIYNTLHGFHNNYFKANGIWIVSCLADQAGPNYIGKDENKRFEFSLNLTIEIMNFEGGRSNGNS